MSRGRGRLRSNTLTALGEPKGFPQGSNIALAPGSQETEEPFEYLDGMSRGRGRLRSDTLTPLGEPKGFPQGSNIALAPGSQETEEPFKYLNEPLPPEE